MLRDTLRAMPKVLITGSTGLLGSAVVPVFTDAGWDVAAPTGAEHDLSTDEGARGAVAGAGELDAVAHLVGGFAAGQPVAETPFETFHAMWHLNVEIAYRVAHAAIPALAGDGAMVLVSSAAAFRPFAGAAGYCSSKAAIVPLAQVIDAEGTRCNAVVPTMIGEGGTAPEAIAQAILWLCSPESAAVRGAAVPV